MKQLFKQFNITVQKGRSYVIATMKHRLMKLTRTSEENYVLQMEFKRKDAKDASAICTTKKNGKVAVTRMGISLAGLVLLRKLIDTTLGSELELLKLKQAEANLDDTNIRTLMSIHRLETMKVEDRRQTEEFKRTMDCTITKKAFEWLYSQAEMPTKEAAFGLWMHEYDNPKPAVEVPAPTDESSSD